jgi:hypothetical protein
MRENRNGRRIYALADYTVERTGRGSYFGRTSRFGDMHAMKGVCTENSVRIDCVTESPKVSGDDRSVLPLPGPVRLTVQVEEPT